MAESRLKIDNLRRFKGQHEGTLLALRSVLFERMASHQKIGIIPMGADQGTAKTALLAANLFQFAPQVLAQLWFAAQSGRIMQIRFLATGGYLSLGVLQQRHQTLQIGIPNITQTGAGADQVFVPGSQLGRFAALLEQLVTLL